jgi:hypothetical protein
LSNKTCLQIRIKYNIMASGHENYNKIIKIISFAKMKKKFLSTKEEKK